MTEYEAYLQAQIAKTQRYRHLHHERVNRLAHLWLSTSPLHGQRVLCVGCRNSYELAVLQLMGAAPVGIDLVAFTPEIHVMDMHALTFAAQTFDAVFSCHSLEHAFDLPAALKEWRRVSKPHAIWAIEVPVRFPLCATDRHDVGSLDGLIAACQPITALASKEIMTTPGIARLIGRL